MIYLIFAVYVIVINIIGFLVMCLDKNKARKGTYRIREKTIFLIAIFLGAIGVYIGMYKFRHKTKHMTFTIGIPVCVALNLLTIWYIFSNNILIYISNMLNL